MSFDGPAESFISAWVNGRLGPNKTKEAALSRRVDGSVDTLYSYAVPIASILGGKYIVVSTREALSRTSVTTNKHLRWVESAVAGKGADPGRKLEWLPRLTPFAPEQIATLTEGKIPTNEYDWQMILVMFDARNEGQPGILK